jgi:hypothetical protein
VDAQGSERTLNCHLGDPDMPLAGAVAEKLTPTEVWEDVETMIALFTDVT